MAVPGPSAAAWGPELILWALTVVVVGEGVRYVVARWVPAWRTDEPIERLLLDLYVGGGLFYLVAALPVGLFGRPLVVGVPLIAAGGLVAALVTRRRAGRPDLRSFVRRLASPGPIVAIAVAAGLFAVELVAAAGAPTGNTFDSSLLTTYTSLLIQHGRIPLSFAPYGTPMILYPQGTTVWLGGAQLLTGTPPARTALLVTPLFLGLAPLSAYVAGRRLIGSETAAVGLAIATGLLGPATRAMAAGSNDFVVAFPLVLWLFGRAADWRAVAVPSWGDAAGFGILLGYSAAINPVGAEWMFPALVLFGAVLGPRALGRSAAWFARWLTALGAALVPVLPSLYVLVLGRSSPGFVPGAAGAPGASPVGLSVAQWVGSIDPWLWGRTDLGLSPVPIVRAELMVLLGVGLVLLLRGPWAPRLAVARSAFGAWAFSAGVTIVGGLSLLTVANVDGSVFGGVANVTSGAELSIWLFALYGLVAAVPLVAVLDRLAAASSVAPAPPTRTRGNGSRPRVRLGGTAAPLVVALAIVGPGLVLTPTGLAPVLGSLYHDFGAVSPGDFALLACGGAHLPAGSRVLVAPGSAAEFLPGYAPHITLLYPLEPGWPWANLSYRIVVRELSNGTLDPAWFDSLHVNFVAVTGNNTVLWPAFWPNPFLRDPGAFAEVFHAGDAYLFSTDAAAPPFPCG
ncbi:MAG TPA: hypothetical protein VML53_07815 [Thermoplasmata archaeon]|nr:hypothetical protein [Thermoplasmata archaeon]